MRAASGLVVTVTLLIVLLGRGAAENSQPYRADLELLAKRNVDFRRVLFTTDHVQIVAMSIPPNEDIGPEVHQVDQCFFFVEGGGTTMVSGRVAAVKENDVLCVPAGLRHNVRNSGPVPLKLYTFYSPPQHPAGTVHHTKQDAQEAEQVHHRGSGPGAPNSPLGLTPAPSRSMPAAPGSPTHR